MSQKSRARVNRHFLSKSAVLRVLCQSHSCNRLHENAVKMPRSATKMPRESEINGFGAGTEVAELLAGLTLKVPNPSALAAILHPLPVLLKWSLEADQKPQPIPRKRLYQPLPPSQWASAQGGCQRAKIGLPDKNVQSLPVSHCPGGRSQPCVFVPHPEPKRSVRWLGGVLSAVGSHARAIGGATAEPVLPDCSG